MIAAERLCVLQLVPGKRRLELSMEELQPYLQTDVSRVCRRWPRLTPSCELHITRAIEEVMIANKVLMDLSFDFNAGTMNAMVWRSGLHGIHEVRVSYKWAQ